MGVSTQARDSTFLATRFMILGFSFLYILKRSGDLRRK